MDRWMMMTGPIDGIIIILLTRMIKINNDIIIIIKIIII